MPPFGTQEGGGASLGDVLTKLQGISSGLSNIYAALKALLPRVTGSFTFPAAATTTITEPAITATSIVQLIPTNASAATLVGSAKSPYVSARVAGTSFTVATASAAAAAGTETFTYILTNPV